MLFGSKSLKICAFICFISMVSAFPSSDENNHCSNYCQNDGICVVIKNQRQCYCLPGWTGKLCKEPRESRIIRLDPSQQSQLSSARNHPCSLVPPNFCNGGICQFDGTKKEYSCVCPFDKAGDRCERASPCNDLCLNGGTCTLKGITATCECTDLFEGTRCDVPKTTAPPTTTVPPTTLPPTTTPLSDICVAFMKFCNGGGCVMENDRPKCKCPPTKTGEYCEIGTGTTRTTAGPATPGPATPGPATPGPATPGPGTPGPGTPGPGTPGPGTVNPGGNSDDACSSNPCQNNRPCYNNGNTFYCFCGSAFSGPTCATASG